LSKDRDARWFAAYLLQLENVWNQAEIYKG
jgi:hypothetical protein